jgi:hypothetical protein
MRNIIFRINLFWLAGIFIILGLCPFSLAGQPHGAQALNHFMYAGNAQAEERDVWEEGYAELEERRAELEERRAEMEERLAEMEERRAEMEERRLEIGEGPPSVEPPSVEPPPGKRSPLIEDSVTFGQDRVVGPDDVVRDAVVIGGDLTVLGTVRGEAVCIGGKLTVGPGAVIRGDLVNVGGTLTVDPSAQTYGDRVNIGGEGFPFSLLKGLKGIGKEKPSDEGWLDVHKDLGTNGFAARLLRLVMDFVYLLLLLFFALLLTTFLPRQFENMEAHLTSQFPQSILLGITSMVGVPLILLAFVISLIGILFIPFFLVALFISCLMGYIVFSRVLGRRVLSGKPIMLQIVGGLLLLHAAFLIGDVLLLPGGAVYSIIGHVFRGVGKVIFFCANFIGLGAVLYSIWGKRELAVAAAGTPEVPPEPPEVPSKPPEVSPEPPEVSSEPPKSEGSNDE